MTHGMMIIGSMRPRVKRLRIKVSAEVGRQWPVEAVVCVQWLVASKGGELGFVRVEVFSRSMKHREIFWISAQPNLRAAEVGRQCPPYKELE